MVKPSEYLSTISVTYDLKDSTEKQKGNILREKMKKKAVIIWSGKNTSPKTNICQTTSVSN